MATNTSGISRLKEFKFRVEINGFNAVLVREFNIGKCSISETGHAGAGQNFEVYEAGGLKFEPAILRYVVPAEGEGGDFFVQKMKLAQDAETGNGLEPNSYKFVFSLYENKPTDQTVRNWTFYGAWVRANAPQNKSSVGFDKDVIDEVEIRYDYYTESRV